ncbi:MAG: ABC transporter permease [Candidatus Acidiferrum sp.]
MKHQDQTRRYFGLSGAQDLWRDLHYANRIFRRGFVFTALAIVTLAMGVGATTTIFSVVSSILLKPLSYQDSARLIAIFSTYPRFQGLQIAVSLRDWMELRSYGRCFEASTFYNRATMDLSGGNEPIQIWSTQVSDQFFDVFGAHAAMGRFFSSAEQLSPNGQVAVVSSELWSDELGGRRDIIGASLKLDGQFYTIVGVAPAGFDVPGASGQFRTKVWLPIQPIRTVKTNAHFANSLPGGVVARLRPGFTLREARAELSSLSDVLQREYPENDRDWLLQAISVQEEVTGDERPALMILLGAVSLFLIITCANVGGVLLSRGLQRQSEIAIRMALGASRARIARQLLVESLWLGCLGGGLGVIGAVGGVRLFRLAAPSSVPRLAELRPNLDVLWYGLGCTLLVGILFGLAPVLQCWKIDVNAGLKHGGMGRTTSARNYLRSVVIVAEVALSLALTIGSILLVESFSNLTRQSTGMDINQVISVGLELPTSKYPDHAHVENFIRQVVDRIRSLPSIDSVGASDLAVLGGGANVASHIEVEGNDATSGGIGNIEICDVSPDFFRTLRIPLYEGRVFQDQDTGDAPLVAVINRSMAVHFWGNRDPIGGNISFDKDERGRQIWLSVIGVVGDTRDANLESAPRPELYTPLFQHTTFSGIEILVRTRQPLLNIAPALRQQIWMADKEQPISRIETLEEVVSGDIAEPRFRAILLTGFAGFGLLLAALGIYGMVSYFVAQHTREIGIRVAMGAQRLAVFRFVLKRGMSLVLLGIGLGVLLAGVLSRLLAGELFGVRTTDLNAYLISSIVLCCMGIFACLTPAVRASRVDPLVALRDE